MPSNDVGSLGKRSATKISVCVCVCVTVCRFLTVHRLSPFKRGAAILVLPWEVLIGGLFCRGEAVLEGTVTLENENRRLEGVLMLFQKLAVPTSLMRQDHAHGP